MIAHLEGLIRHGRRNSLSGELIRGSIEAVKLEAGMPGTFFELDYYTLHPLITDCWIKSVWRETTILDIQVIERTPVLQLNRNGDVFLIQAFLEKGYKGRRLERLNRCRIYLQVLSLADICSGSGTYIIPSIKQGHNPYPTNDHLDWPAQSSPTTAMWTEWRQALHNTFPHYNNMLTRHLGQWLTIIPCRSAVVDRANRDLYIKHNQLWQCFRRNRNIFTGNISRFLDPIQ